MRLLLVTTRGSPRGGSFQGQHEQRAPPRQRAKEPRKSLRSRRGLPSLARIFRTANGARAGLDHGRRRVFRARDQSWSMEGKGERERRGFRRRRAEAVEARTWRPDPLVRHPGFSAAARRTACSTPWCAIKDGCAVWLVSSAWAEDMQRFECSSARNGNPGGGGRHGADARTTRESQNTGSRSTARNRGDESTEPYCRPCARRS